MPLKETKGRKMGGVAASGRPLRQRPKTVTTGRIVGGVSAEAPGHALEVRRSTRPGTGPAALSHADFVYNGGPVITCPLIYTSFWGSLWLTDAAHIQRAGRFTQFCTDLVNSNYMNVLSQYAVGSRLFLQASFIDNVPASLTVSDIHNVIQSAINSGAIPEPPANNTTQILGHLPV
jgi:hypothetical protein